MVLGKLPVPGRPTIWITVGQGLTALAVGSGWGCLDSFTLIYPFFPFSPSLWETARYRLKYCLKGPLNPKPTNQPTSIFTYFYINTINNETPHLKPQKNQNRRAALGRPAIKLQGVGGGALTSLRSTNPRPYFCLDSSDKTITTKASNFKTRPNHSKTLNNYF